MGLLKMMATSVKVAAQRSAAGGDVEVQVQAQFEEVYAALRANPDKIPPEYAAALVPVYAAGLVEAQMLDGLELLIEQLQMDGRRAMPLEVQKNIIDTVRDIKMTALEADGVVNPIDLAAVKITASGLKGKARTYLMSARMAGAKEIGPTLDAVERRLLGDATSQYGHDYAKWQRAAQATIWAVSALREQQLVGR